MGVCGSFVLGMLGGLGVVALGAITGRLHFWWWRRRQPPPIGPSYPLGWRRQPADAGVKFCPGVHGLHCEGCVGAWTVDHTAEKR